MGQTGSENGVRMRSMLRQDELVKALIHLQLIDIEIILFATVFFGDVFD